MAKFSDRDAALIDDIRNELKVLVVDPKEMLRFEMAVAKVVAAHLAANVKNKKKAENGVSD